MALTNDIKTTKNEPESSANKNGPGTISDALTAFEAHAVKLPTGPAPADQRAPATLQAVEKELAGRTGLVSA